MPYIICVNQPGCLPEADPVAVATIEEVADHVEAEADRRFEDIEPYTLEMHRQYRSIIEAWHSMDEGSGGVIGPLPDGYVIDVRHVEWRELADLAGIPGEEAEYMALNASHGSSARIIDAYNQQ